MSLEFQIFQFPFEKTVGIWDPRFLLVWELIRGFGFCFHRRVLFNGRPGGGPTLAKPFCGSCVHLCPPLLQVSLVAGVYPCADLSKAPNQREVSKSRLGPGKLPSSMLLLGHYLIRLAYVVLPK